MHSFFHSFDVLLLLFCVCVVEFGSFTNFSLSLTLHSPSFLAFMIIQLLIQFLVTSYSNPNLSKSSVTTLANPNCQFVSDRSKVHCLWKVHGTAHKMRCSCPDPQILHWIILTPASSSYVIQQPCCSTWLHPRFGHSLASSSTSTQKASRIHCLIYCLPITYCDIAFLD